MAGRGALLCFAVALLALTCPASAARSDVVELTRDNFAGFVGMAKGALVKFFTSWCGHCKRMAPEFEKVASTFRKTEGVVIGAINCEAEETLCKRFEVTGYPTVKWFTQGSMLPDEYKGKREAEPMIEYVNKRLGLEVPGVVTKSYIVTLDPDTFDQIVLDTNKHVLVAFVASWCGMCKIFMPHYEMAAEAFEREESVVIAKVDADVHTEYLARFGIEGYPTILWFPRTNKTGTKYDRSHRTPDLVKFINKKAGTKRTEDGRLTTKAGRVKKLDEVAAKYLVTGEEERQQLRQQAEAIAAELGDSKAKEAEQYLKVMRTVDEKGHHYVAEEVDRLSKLLEGDNLKPEKADEFILRKNVLTAFLEFEEDEEPAIQ